jgi:hypothetical protein
MKRPVPQRLYHYCCHHSAIDIRREMQLRCAQDILVERNLQGQAARHPQGFIVWLTDMEPPAYRVALGLTMHTTDCDRIEFCFEVEPDWTRMEWYMTFRRRHPELRPLEGESGSMPAHWYVARGPIPVVREVQLRKESV